MHRRLQARFTNRITVVRAGAGFGKSTSLAQAVEQNKLNPKGADVWLACEPADCDADHLIAGLREAVGLDGDGPLEDVAMALVEMAPTEVCLILDDLHEVGPGSQGAASLDRLLADLPANGHMVLASRHEPAVALARLEAQGHVHTLGEDVLALTATEIGVLAERAGVDASHLSGLGGWPALVSLALRSRDAHDFVDEEVVAWLTEDQRRGLALVVSLGTADVRLLAEMAGIEADTILSGLPLVHEADGWFEAHDLWRDRLVGGLTVQEVRAHQRRAVELLLAWGESSRAVDLCLFAGLDDLTTGALRAAILNVGGPPVSVLRRWLAAVPDSTRSHPVGRFLAGLVVRTDAPTAPLCLELFAQSVEGFRSISDSAGEVEGLAQLGYLHHVQRDQAGLAEIGGRLVELALGGEEAALPYASIAGAFVELSSGDPAAVREALGRIEIGTLTAEFEVIADWLKAQALNMLGYPAVDIAERCVASALPIPGLADVQLGSRWHAGDIDFLTDESRWAPIPDGDRDRFLRHLFRAGVATLNGRHDGAESELETALALAAENPVPATRITTGVVAIALRIELDPTSDPGPTIDGLLAQHPVDKTNRFYYGAMRALLARYRPELWAFWADADGPLAIRDRDIGFALGAVDRDHDRSAVARLAWPREPGEIVTAVGLGGACLLTAAAHSLGRPEAQPTIDWLAHSVGTPARRHFRLLIDHPVGEIAEAAAQIVERTPMRPVHQVKVGLLGPSVLHHGDLAVDDTDWRRGNVRALLALMATSPALTRDHAMLALWPDADEASARRSIRSTLNLLHGVLEPNRQGGDAPFFIRSEGSALRLVPADRLEIDVWDFEERLSRADELIRDGVPELALDPLRQAVALYRGDFVVDLFHDALALERDRLRSRFVSAGCLLARLLASSGEREEAVAVAAAVLNVEPWVEAAHLVVIEAHLARGERAAALSAAERCRDELRDFGGPGEVDTIRLMDQLDVGA